MIDIHRLRKRNQETKSEGNFLKKRVNINGDDIDKS